MYLGCMQWITAKSILVWSYPIKLILVQDIIGRIPVQMMEIQLPFSMDHMQDSMPEQRRQVLRTEKEETQSSLSQIATSDECQGYIAFH